MKILRVIEQKLWHLKMIPLAFILSPRKFCGLVIKYDSKNNNEATVLQSVKKFRKNHLKAFTIIIMILLSAYLVLGFNLNLPKQAFPSILVAYAVLAKCGYEIQTWGGDSVVEKINNLWFKIIYSIGIFWLVIVSLQK